MNKTISKLPNGDFQVEDDTIVYGIRKYIKEERTMREKLRPIHRAPDPDIAILDDIILGAHKRIGLYQMLDKGLWHSIFGTDNTDEIVRERELIREYTQMKREIIEWKKRQKTTPWSLE